MTLKLQVEIATWDQIIQVGAILVDSNNLMKLIGLKKDVV